MEKNLSNRFKQLIGESIAEDKKPLLSSDNVTDEQLAETLAKIEAEKADKKALNEAAEKEFSEGWDEETEVLSEGTEKKDSELLSEGTEEDTVYDLSFLNESEEK